MTVNLDRCVAVVPVVDYEPPPRDVQHCKPVPATALRRPGARASGRPAGHHPVAAMSPTLRAAADFADAALRRVLEVIDRRRPVTQLRPLLTSGLVDSVLALNRGAVNRQGAAVLRRVRLQAVGLNDAAKAAEVFGTYSRGRRVHAIACRVEQLPPADGNRWQVVALHIG